MPQETQNNFSGGLNTRYPSHLIPENQATELTDVDLSYGDLRGDYGMAAGGFQEYYYEEGDTWVDSGGFTFAVAVIDWPYSSSSTTQTISTNANYFSILSIGTNSTITIADGVTVEVFESSRGVFGANSFVEYNKDLYISRSDFTITASYNHTSGIGGSVLNVDTGADTFKLQVGDILSGTGIVTNSFIKSIDTVNNRVEINNPVEQTQSSASVTIKPIISRFLDGDISEGFRVTTLPPDPVITFSQNASLGSQTNRDTYHSDAWYAQSYAVPFQYGLAHYDSTGVESSMSELTDSKISATYFPTGSTSNNLPQYVSISGTTVSTSTNDKLGRHALYRVGGSSSVVKRVANLYFDGTTITTTQSGSDLTVALASATNTHQYRVAWYVFHGSGATYNWTNADGTQVATTRTGQTDFRSPNSGSISFQLTGSGTNHYADIFVWVRIPGERIEREYVLRAFTHHASNVANANTYAYVDFTSSDSLIDIQPISENNEPERSLKFLTESGNLFYAAKGTRVFVSEYGNANSWPETAFVDFDQEVTALDSLGAELVVFTNYGIYRVFGTDPKNLKRIQIPTTEGVPVGLHKCVTRYQQGLLFASHNGICFYDGKSIQRMSHNTLDSFTPPDSTNSNNCAGFFEDVFYLLGSTGNGYKYDIRQSPPKLTRTSMTSNTLFYRGAVNTLYSPNGRPGYPDGSRQAFTAKTRGFVGGDINREKVYYGVNISATDFKGTVNVIVDGATTDTFTITNAVVDYDRTLYVSVPRRGNLIQIQLSSCEGIVNRITVNFDFTDQLTDRLFNSAQIQYTGTPTVNLSVDGDSKISQTLTSPAGVIGEAKIYFPAMSTGIVPFVRENNGEESGRVINFSYDSQAI
jgi:hypothetical protein